MKTWPKKRGRLYNRGIPNAVLAAALLGAALFLLWVGRDAAFRKAMAEVPEPDACALCGGRRYHAPCLVNLATGEVGELCVYDADPQNRAELAPVQQTGTFCAFQCAGVPAYRDTISHTSHAELPEGGEPLNPAFFCRPCRALLAGTAARGYVLLDLYDLNAIRLFPIEDGAKYPIRDYTVSTQRSAEGSTVSVTGHWGGR